jgi:hypothetical protein
MTRISKEHGGLAFDELVSKAPEPLRSALVNVCDTAELCRRWLLEVKLNPTSADVIAPTKLVMDEVNRGRTIGMEVLSVED